MPADQYGFRRVPEELSFGQLIIRIAGANMIACGPASGMPRLAIPQKIAQGIKDEKKDIDKDVAIRLLNGTFEFWDTRRHRWPRKNRRR